LLDIVGGDRADLVELIASFLEEAPQILDSMVAAGNAGDAVTVCRAAHTLKSNARDFGAAELFRRCASLETDLAGRQSFDALAGRVTEIVALWPAVQGALEAEIRALDAEA
jgi:HPt (histidine-containing phosphotransfer) domain-containing protein